MEQELDCYYDYLVSEAKEVTEEQMIMLLWEPIIETSDTTLVTTEWAMYELAKDKNRQVDSFTLPLVYVMRVVPDFNYLMLDSQY